MMIRPRRGVTNFKLYVGGRGNPPPKSTLVLVHLLPTPDPYYEVVAIKLTSDKYTRT